MAKRFYTTGSCYPAEHYMLKPEHRCAGVMGLIEEKHFFAIHALPQRQNSASPFNIAIESLTLKHFSRDDIAALYRQHTDDTGQAFPSDLVDNVYEMTLGTILPGQRPGSRNGG